MKKKGSARPRPGPATARLPVLDPSSEDSHAVVPELPLVEVDVAAGSSRHWIRDVTERWNVRVRFDVCRPMGSDASRLLQVVELIGDPGDLGAAERYLRHRSDIQALTVMPLSPSRRFVRAVTPMPEPCRRIFESGAVCGTCQFFPAVGAEGVDRWTLVVPRTPEALRTVARAQSGPEGSRTSILRMRRFVPKRTLTPRQAAALETAYRLGFYAFPRRTNLKEISRILGVSRSTAAELLRRAESKILAPQLGEP